VKRTAGGLLVAVVQYTRHDKCPSLAARSGPAATKYVEIMSVVRGLALRTIIFRE